MQDEKGIFKRAELLLGDTLMNRIADMRIILFGVGGVGGWCAESLVRTGVRRLTIVDSDFVCETNINRQLMATTKTIGQRKVEALKARLLDINPDAEIITSADVYSEETSASFNLDDYDYIIDAIDSLKHKVHLILAATRTRAKLFSSMGAALKMNPARIKTAEFWKVKGCPLGAALRRKMKQGEKPAKKFICVYSDEVLENKGLKYENDESGSSRLLKQDNPSVKAQINGTLVHVTAIFGFTLAGLIIQDICTDRKTV
ncbi:MAG: tRNA threonylcarbamoyladenosine dehydratase [Prevotella sp.]|nr:tRNA threonylcarbamoyladenosine dehydratase [Prevotella sp.]